MTDGRTRPSKSSVDGAAVAAEEVEQGLEGRARRSDEVAPVDADRVRTATAWTVRHAFGDAAVLRPRGRRPWPRRGSGPSATSPRTVSPPRGGLHLADVRATRMTGATDDAPGAAPPVVESEAATGGVVMKVRARHLPPRAGRLLQRAHGVRRRHRLHAAELEPVRHRPLAGRNEVSMRRLLRVGARGARASSSPPSPCAVWAEDKRSGDLRAASHVPDAGQHRSRRWASSSHPSSSTSSACPAAS